MENQNKGKTVTVLFGIFFAVFAVIFALLTVRTRPARLSQEKMQKKVEEAEREKKEHTNQTEKQEMREAEEHIGQIESFQVSDAGIVREGDTLENLQEAETAQERDASQDSSGYLCSYSAERLMTESDVEELRQEAYRELPVGKEIIQMVINEMYARYGYQFNNEEIQTYFDQKEWYQAISTRNTNMDDVLKRMTDTERSNIQFLSASIEEG